MHIVAFLINLGDRSDKQPYFMQKHKLNHKKKMSNIVYIAVLVSLKFRIIIQILCVVNKLFLGSLAQIESLQ